jgi:hypothetical protein
MAHKTHQNTVINKKQIKRVPDQTGDFLALNSVDAEDGLHVEWAPGVPAHADKKTWREFCEHQAAKANPGKVLS